jgi:hypothetical protein
MGVPALLGALLLKGLFRDELTGSGLLWRDITLKSRLLER